LVCGAILVPCSIQVAAGSSEVGVRRLRRPHHIQLLEQCAADVAVYLLHVRDGTGVLTRTQCIRQRPKETPGDICTPR
jgi:hypothetical protein